MNALTYSLLSLYAQATTPATPGATPTDPAAVTPPPPASPTAEELATAQKAAEETTKAANAGETLNLFSLFEGKTHSL